MSTEEARMHLIEGKDVMLELVYGGCFDFAVVFKAYMCEPTYFGDKVSRLIEGSTDYHWSIA